MVFVANICLSIIPWLRAISRWSCGDADKKDQSGPDQKNIQAEHGNAQEKRFYVEQGQYRIVQEEAPQKEQADQSFVFIIILCHDNAC